MTHPADEVVGIYQRHAEAFDRFRSRELFERTWLERFLAAMPERRHLLDIGCGMGEPIARFLIDKGCKATGIDTSPDLLDRARERFPSHTWIEADMRGLSLGRQFDGLIAFGSFFFLVAEQQRAMFRTFAEHASPGAVLLFTSGPDEGEVIGEFQGEPLYHASLSPAEYRTLLDRNGFDVLRFVPDDPECAQHCVWLCRKRLSGA